MRPVIFARPETPGREAPRLNFIALGIFAVSVAVGLLAWRAWSNPLVVAAIILVGLMLMQSPRIAQQWERAVVLRLGKFIGLQGPGLFWIVPFIDRVSSWIDQRTITTTFA